MSNTSRKKVTPCAYLGLDAVERVWARSDLGEDEAMQVALSELHELRAEKRAARGS